MYLYKMFIIRYNFVLRMHTCLRVWLRITVMMKIVAIDVEGLFYKLKMFLNLWRKIIMILSVSNKFTILQQTNDNVLKKKMKNVYMKSWIHIFICWAQTRILIRSHLQNKSGSFKYFWQFSRSNLTPRWNLNPNYKWSCTYNW